MANVLAVFASMLQRIYWRVGLLVRIAALAAASYSWVQLDSWAWWIGMVSAPVGCFLLLCGALSYFHGWCAMTRHLGWD
ncbi:hypothetical protein BAE29_12730 [Acidithiobacillus caldus]|uniref:Uncharacterized protein n=1 Tax=Acidithiobacillus caldus TaxID=33059 RepID=A0A1E7YKQ6_9PROT|nr:hypothetical protein BAE27_11385 [Acidithiobacillus caldus]OFC32317.1 hypothetical protein BAE28_12360 [Acidithiobacillus caldus]OFC36535.1 hypothetical protein BAE29_12730 [Acidithiobacillus caldus]